MKQFLVSEQAGKLTFHQSLDESVILVLDTGENVALGVVW